MAPFTGPRFPDEYVNVRAELRVGFLYEVLKSYVSNAAELDFLDEYVEELRRLTGDNSAEAVKTLAFALADGLRAGNWPWVLQAARTGAQRTIRM